MRKVVARFRIGFLSFALCLLFFLSFSGQALAAAYTVSPGDTLWKIGVRFGLTVDKLKQANNLTGDAIYPGQTLFIPVGGSSYTVQPGDTLYKIANRYGTSVRELMEANSLTAAAIYPGQKLYIPVQARPAAVSRGNISASEFETLARIITAEADDQSYETKVAVGAVVLNRVDSPLFPDTVRGVVYQVDSGGRYQFEPVLNGWINRPPSIEAINAAADALAGWDPTNGALFFWESWVKNSYLNSRPLAAVIGAFTFTY
ncbi:MAG: LysM peptidoglycan-binding domain-containing protein [Peptococcaceae bacterium]|nr:LysM peptidoglycan-binding domain-containing protein [Peptococcaceae bacterium]